MSGPAGEERALAAAHLAHAHLAEGRLAEAEAGFRRVLLDAAAAAHHGPAYHGLGLVAARGGRPDLAALLLAEAVRLMPARAEAHRHLGQVRLDLGLPARGDLARALVLDPAQPETLEALGRAQAQGHAAWYARALALAPGFVAARFNLGALLADGGAEIRRGLALAPGAAVGWFNRGVRESEGAALASYRRALTCDPASLDAAVNHARRLGPRQPGPALAPLKRALALVPSAAAGWNERARLSQAGLDDDALRFFARALALDPASPALRSNFLQQLLYDPALSDRAILERHLDYGRRHGKDRKRPPRRVPGEPPRIGPLRIGYVSSDLSRHPVGLFLLAALRHRDRSASHVVCYAGGASDPVTAQLQALADGWVETSGLDDEALEARIVADRIDILVDLSGHTAGNRLPLFALRPAPVQASWLGYPGTTGLLEIDAVVADARQVPKAAERFFTERVERLEPGYLAYEPPEEEAAVTELPALKNGHLTFGSLNNLAKLNARILRLWARVLAAVPGSRLRLAWPGLADERVQAHLVARAAAAGIASARLDLRPGGTPAEFLAEYGAIDIALDTQPYAGGLTTLEALWMGVPVLTCPGTRFAGRHAASHLHVAGLDDWITQDEDAFVRKAIAAASDLDRLAGIRRTLRERLAASPLLDGKGFAARLDTLWRNLWQAHAADADDEGLRQRRRLALDPGAAVAWRQRADAEIAREETAGAAQTLARVAALAPAALDLSNLAELRRRLGLAGSGTLLRRALALAPSLAAAHSNLGTLVMQGDRAGRSKAIFARALRCDPFHRDAAYNHAAAAAEAGDPAAAVRLYDAVLQRHPDFFEARWNRALALLACERWREGWQAHEHRRQHPLLAPRRFPMPTWNGEPLAGRRLLVAAEQGLGDTLQFLRYLPALRAREPKARLVLDLPQTLADLARASLEDVEVVESGAPVEADLEAPLMSLPHLLALDGPEDAAVPPYLSVDAARRARWRAWREERGLARDPRPKVGLAWAGNPAMRNDARRSLPEAALARLAGLDAVTFISLQKDRAPPDAAWIDAGPDLHDFADTAALIEMLDLVIAVDTAVAHLAGALGRPLWVLLSTAADWRWPKGPRTPWYPSARQVWRDPEGDWTEALDAVAARLARTPLDVAGDFA